jgi:hypothetical protein
VDLKAFYSSFFDGLFTFKKDDRYLEKMRKIIKEQE